MNDFLKNTHFTLDSMDEEYAWSIACPEVDSIEDNSSEDKPDNSYDNSFKTWILKRKYPATKFYQIFRGFTIGDSGDVIRFKKASSIIPPNSIFDLHFETIPEYTGFFYQDRHLHIIFFKQFYNFNH